MLLQVSTLHLDYMMMHMTDRPKDGQFILKTLDYKIGLHGIVYVWIDNAWIRSTKTAEELMKAWADKSRRIAKDKG